MFKLYRIDRAYLFFICGILIIPAFLFQENPAVRGIQTILFIILAAASGRRVKILPGLLLFIFIIIANIFSPVGRVFFSIGKLPVTAGALRNGLLKGTMLIGLIYLSRFSISPGIRIPGSFGTIIGKVFFYFECIMKADIKITAGNFIGQIDRLLMDVDLKSGETPSDTPAVIRSGYLVFLMPLLVLLNWGALYFNSCLSPY